MIRKKKKVKELGPVGKLLISAFCLIFSFLILYMSVEHFLIIYDSKTWPTTDGIVVYSKINREDRRKVAGREKYIRTYYNAIINYVYIIDSKKYYSKRVSIDYEATTDGIMHNDIVTEFPVGKKIKVYYHPDKPEYAIIKPGLYGNTFYFILFGIIILVLGIRFLIKGISML